MKTGINGDLGFGDPRFHRTVASAPTRRRICHPSQTQRTRQNAMRNGFVGSVAVVLICNLAAWAQPGPGLQPFMPPSPPTPGYYPRGDEVDADSDFVRDNR